MAYFHVLPGMQRIFMASKFLQDNEKIISNGYALCPLLISAAYAGLDHHTKLIRSFSSFTSDLPSAQLNAHTYNFSLSLPCLEAYFALCWLNFRACQWLLSQFKRWLNFHLLRRFSCQRNRPISREGIE